MILKRSAIVFFVPLACAAAPSAPAGQFEITILDGTTLQGELVEISPRVRIKTVDGTTDLGWADILSITPPGSSDSAREPNPKYAAWRFTLADGSLFYGLVVGSTENDFIVEFDGQRTCRLSLDALKSLVSTKASGAARSKLAEIARDPRRAIDYAVIARDEQASVLRGAVRRITKENVVFEWNRRTVPIPWARLAGVYFSETAPRSPSSRVFMTTGEVYAGRVRSGSPVSITLQSSVFDNLELPWANIDRIECISDRLRFLSDLKPHSYEFEPFFEKSWELAVDQSLSGQPIRLGGKPYARGICMHSQADVIYRIGGQYRQFAFVAGILDEMENRGNVTMRVLGDGRLLWQKEDVRGGQPPQAVVLSVVGVHELALRVEFGKDLDLSDHACWAFARLIR